MPAPKNWIPFDEARRIVVSQNFKRSQDFKDWSARPANIPYTPDKAYKNEGSTGDPGRSVLELRKTVEVEVTAWQGAA